MEGKGKEERGGVERDKEGRRGKNGEGEKPERKAGE